jgi:hypothetical protein
MKIRSSLRTLISIRICSSGNARFSRHRGILAPSMALALCAAFFAFAILQTQSQSDNQIAQAGLP